jgi:hypothetical protein
MLRTMITVPTNTITDDLGESGDVGATAARPKDEARDDGRRVEADGNTNVPEIVTVTKNSAAFVSR